MKPMFNPPHPGEALREDVLPALGLTVSEAARQLGVSRVALSRVLHGRAGISVDLARRLEAWLATEHGGPTAESFLREQTAYNLWQLRQSTPLPPVQRARWGGDGDAAVVPFNPPGLSDLLQTERVFTAFPGQPGL